MTGAPSPSYPELRAGQKGHAGFVVDAVKLVADQLAQDRLQRDLLPPPPPAALLAAASGKSRSSAASLSDGSCMRNSSTADKWHRELSPSSSNRSRRKHPSHSSRRPMRSSSFVHFFMHDRPFQESKSATLGSSLRSPTSMPSPTTPSGGVRQVAPPAGWAELLYEPQQPQRWPDEQQLEATLKLPLSPTSPTSLEVTLLPRSTSLPGIVAEPEAASGMASSAGRKVSRTRPGSAGGVPKAARPSKTQELPAEDAIPVLSADPAEGWSRRVLKRRRDPSVRQESIMAWVDQVMAEAGHEESGSEEAGSSASGIEYLEAVGGDTFRGSKLLARFEGRTSVDLASPKAPGSHRASKAATGRAKWAAAASAARMTKAFSSSSLSQSISPKGDGVASGELDDGFGDFESERAKPGVISDVFDQLSEEGVIDRENLAQALIDMTRRSPKQEWINQIVEKHFNDRSALDKQDLVEFVDLYQTQHHQFMVAIFKEVDEDGSGAISPDEVVQLLERRGVTPVPGAVEQLFKEVTGQDTIRDINFQEFLVVYEMVHERAGFTEKELQGLRNIWSRLDSDGNGTLDADELRAALRWQGFVIDGQVVDRLVKEVQKGKHGLTQEEYLTVMRKYREAEVDKMLSTYQRQHGQTQSVLILEDELPSLFVEVGYTQASPDVIEEAAAVVKLQQSKRVGQGNRNVVVQERPALTFDDMYKLMSTFREAKGFLFQELAELVEVFERFCVVGEFHNAFDDAEIDANDVDEGSNSAEEHAEDQHLTAMQLTNLLRWLGYPALLWKVQELLDGLDLSSNEFLDKDEFMKAMAELRELETKCVRSALKDMRQEEELDSAAAAEEKAKKTSWRVLPASRLKSILKELGYSTNQPQMAILLREDLDVSGNAEDPTWAVSNLLRKHRTNVRQFVQSHSGFTQDEVARLRQLFNTFDTQQSGTIKGKQMMRFLSELVSGKDTDEQQLLRKMMEKANQGDKSELDFQDYLYLMRLRTDQWSTMKLGQEREALASCGFTSSEIGEFRKIFNAAAVNEMGQGSLSFGVAVTAVLSLSIGEVENMMVRVAGPCGDGKRKALKDLLMKHDEGHKDALTFAEFLTAVRMIMDKNWHNINSEAEKLAKKTEETSKAAAVLGDPEERKEARSS